MISINLLDKAIFLYINNLLIYLYILEEYYYYIFKVFNYLFTTRLFLDLNKLEFKV